MAGRAPAETRRSTAPWFWTTVWLVAAILLVEIVRLRCPIGTHGRLIALEEGPTAAHGLAQVDSPS